MKVIEMGVGQENQIDGWQIFDSQSGMLNPLQEEQPICKVWVDERVEFLELNQKGGVPY